MTEIKTTTYEYDDEGRVSQQVVVTEVTLDTLQPTFEATVVSSPSAEYKPTHGGYPDLEPQRRVAVRRRSSVAF